MEVNLPGGGLKSCGSWPNVSSCVNILLVDNDAASLVHTASLLQEEFYNVATSQSAAQALKFFEARKGFYDILIADFQMQDMNIYDFIRCIQDQCFSCMPIILMAEDYPMDLGKEALQKGASYFFQKPLTPADIKYLWQQIAHLTGRIPGATSTQQNKRSFTDYNDENGNQRKNRRLTFTEALPRETLNTGNNEHGYLQASRDLQKTNVGQRHRDFGCYTVDGVEKILKELNSNIAMNGTRENVIMNTTRVEVAGQNGGFQIPVEGGGQVNPTNGYMSSPIQGPNQEASGDLGRVINCHEITGNLAYNMNTGQGTTSPDNTTEEHLTADDIAQILESLDQEDLQLAPGNGGVPLFMEGGQVTPRNGDVSRTLQVPNQEASGDLGYLNTGQGNASTDNTIEGQLTALKKKIN